MLMIIIYGYNEDGDNDNDDRKKRKVNKKDIICTSLKTTSTVTFNQTFVNKKNINSLSK